MNKSTPACLVLAAIAAVMATPALAQLSTHGGAIDINSDKLEVMDTKNEAIFTGRVDALQGDARLRADKLDVLFDKVDTKAGETRPLGVSWGAVNTIVATGHVYYVTPKQVATADKAIYDVAKDQVTMLGNVVVTQGKNVIRGNKLILQISTGRAVFAPGMVEGGKQGRVRAVFFPNATPKTGQDTPPGTDQKKDQDDSEKTPEQASSSDSGQ